jgi:hypothetical protein
VFVKIDEAGNVAIAHSTELTHTVQKPFQDDTKTFFRVDWKDTSAVQNIISNFATIRGCYKTIDDMCMCEVMVSEMSNHVMHTTKHMLLWIHTFIIPTLRPS